MYTLYMCTYYHIIIIIIIIFIFIFIFIINRAVGEAGMGLSLPAGPRSAALKRVS